MKKIDILYIVTFLGSVILAWHKVLQTTIGGEGFYYFSPSTSLFYRGNLADLAHGIDNFAKIATYFLEKQFAGNIQGYINFQFGVMLLISLTFYIFVRLVTKNPHIAFIAATYTSINYTASYQIYARGHFQWFLQRAPEKIPVLISFYFLHLFVKNRKFKNYLLSFIAYWFALFISNYSTLFLSFFPAYLLVHALNNTEKINEKIKLILMSIPFVILAYIITSSASLNLSTIHPNQTFVQSLLSLTDLIPKISFQLTSVTFPFSLLKIISNITKQEYMNLIYSLIVPVILFYIFALSYLKKKNSEFYNLFLALFLALIGNLFINVYLNRIKVTAEIEQGRYYFIPSIYVGIMFSIFTFEVLKNLKLDKKVRVYISIFIIASALVVSNTALIWKKMDDSQYFYTATNNILNLLNTKKNTFSENAVVFIPHPPGSNSIDFMKKYYGNKNTTYIYLDINWLNKIPENTPIENIFVYDIVDRTKVVDKTNEYREIIKKGTFKN